jgi:hypothetical protein
MANVIFSINALFADSSAIYHLGKYLDAPNNKADEKDRSNEANGPISHLSIQTAEKIVPAIDTIIRPAVFIRIPSMRLSRALICSYRMLQTSS